METTHMDEDMTIDEAASREPTLESHVGSHAQQTFAGHRSSQQGVFKKILRYSWAYLQYGFDWLLDAGEGHWHVIKREGELFFGTALSLIGVFMFQNGKNCDGNTADYLSCTRPSTFYYYGGFEIFLIVVGVFFILLWFLQRDQE